MTADYHPYEVYHPDSESPPPPDARFWTFREAVQQALAWNKDFPGHTVRRRRPRNKTEAINAMLQERGLTGWRAWYVGRRFLNGWMVNDDPTENGMQLLGGSYAQAVEMVRSGSLDFLAGKVRP